MKVKFDPQYGLFYLMNDNMFKGRRAPEPTESDYRTAEQLFNELMDRDAQLQLEINQLKNQLKSLTDRMMILYKEFKKFGHSIEMFD